MADLTAEANRLLKASMAENSWQTYKAAVDSFDHFRYIFCLQQLWPAPVDHIVHFIAYLSAKNQAPATIRTYISGLSYRHKIHGLSDATKSFIVTKLLEGVTRSSQHRDTRAPITFNILVQIIQALDHVCESSYEVFLFRAAFSLAFYGFLRVGELTSKSLKSLDPRPLRLGDIDIETRSGHKQVKMTIRQSKTDQVGQSTTLYLLGTGGPTCPVTSLSKFLAVRHQNSSVDSQLLVHFDGNPLTRYQFSTILGKTLKFCNINKGHFRSHSFRIGAATEAAMRGIPDTVIKQWGRWKSGAYTSYIRLQ